MQGRRSSGALPTYTPLRKRDAQIAPCMMAEKAHGIYVLCCLTGISKNEIRHESKIVVEATSPHLPMLLKVALHCTGQPFFPDTVDLSKLLY